MSIPKLAGGIPIFILMFLIVFVVTCATLVDEVKDQGLSNIIEEVWVGTDTTATTGE